MVTKKSAPKKPKSPNKTKASPKKVASRKGTSKSLKGFKAVQGEIVEPGAAPAKELEEQEPLVADPEGDEDETNLDLESPTPAGSAITTSDPVSRYMAELGRYPLLTREQERELAVRYRETGDAKAAEKLVTSNLRFVVKIAAEYTRFGARLIDLVQEGNVGLMHAVKEFNPYKGVRLITYAVWWIRGYIQEYLMRQYSMVRIGTTTTQRKLFYQLQKQREELERMGLEQGIAQLSGKLGVPEEEVQAMHARLSGRDVSLDAPVSEDGSTRLVDLQSEADPSALDDELGAREEINLLRAKIEELRPSLNEREQYLLDARLLADEPMTLQEIGDKYGTTREAVRQMEARLMQKIKRTLVADET
ncbi:MAG: RNA polymerase factor sigma-32 [Bdellovibrionales bacterium]|nr:RNA polymerase factor sigma-32 [Bdellovibrionales bacterium]